MKIFSLSSGSKGNCLFIKAENTSILVDAGISYNSIVKGLSLNGEDILNVSAVLITHEHSDHIKGLPVLVKHNPQIKIYAHKLVCSKLKEFMPIVENNLVEILTPVFYIGDFLVSAFRSPHDSIECLNYSIYENDKKFSIITDCGKIKSYHLDEVKDSNLLYIESNHNLEMLKMHNEYSEKLKMRILSEHGHLSNNQAGEFVADVLKNSPSCQIVLCHISSNTNTHFVAIDEVSKIVKQKIGVDVKLKIAPELQTSDIFII